MTCGSKSLNSGKGMEKKNIEKYLLYDNDMMRMIFSHDILKSNIRRKAIGRAKAGRGEETVAKFRKFKKTENTFTLKI